MSVAYIAEQGSTILKKGRQLLVIKDSKVLKRILAKDLKQLVIFGNVNISTPAMKFLLREGIETIFLSLSGKYLGRLVSSYSKNIDLRRLQFKVSEIPDFIINTAREIVLSKVTNQLETLRRFQLKISSDEIRKTLDKLKRLLLKIKNCNKLPQLRGYEGVASAFYFGTFNEILSGCEIKFWGRNYYPPQDEFNSMLSFLYTLLFNTVENFVLVHSLEPMLGVFHAPEYGKPSLILDLMEEWRPVVADYIALQMVRQGKITKKDFYRPEEENPPYPELLEDFKELPVVLRKDAIKKLLVAYEKRLTIKIKAGGEERSFRELIEMQVLKYKRAIEEMSAYEGFKWRR